jgi:Uncharacterized conserved protein
VLRGALIALAVLVLLSWTLLAVLASRLPPGLVKDLVGFLPACVTLLRRLRRDPRVPISAKIALACAALWVISPIDLIPEFLPVIGPLDDIVVVALALRYAARRVPREVLLEAWPGDPRLLLRLLGVPRDEIEFIEPRGPCGIGEKRRHEAGTT